MKPLLLIAEGDAALRDRHQRLLTARDYEVAVAADGLECVRKLSELNPDVLVLDLELNWGGGDGVLAWLREERPLPWVRVVLMAAAGSPELLSELGEPPVAACLGKPFELTALPRSVRAALARRIQIPRHGSHELARPALLVSQEKGVSLWPPLPRF